MLTVFDCSEYTRILTVLLLGDSEITTDGIKCGEKLNVLFYLKFRHYLVIPRMYHKICETGQ